MTACHRDTGVLVNLCSPCYSYRARWINDKGGQGSVVEADEQRTETLVLTQAAKNKPDVTV